MRLSADYPDKIRACVIEDMDARPRGPEMSSLFDYSSLRAFTPVGRKGVLHLQRISWNDETPSIAFPRFVDNPCNT